MFCNKIHIAATALVAVLLAGAACSEETGARLEQSRAVTRQLQQRLLADLSGALAEGGPVQAIDVCKDKALAIADALSAETGARISRTALRVRNPANAAAPWQQAVLRDFQKRLAGGEPADQVEWIESAPGEGTRYMKALPTGPLCLQCHGGNLAPDVQEALRRLYPEDVATGFAAGELRGAVSIVWPVEAQE